jgi:hypothetical protein
MAGRFTVRSQVGISACERTYADTPAGHLLAARDNAADKLWLRGHEMMHWSKVTAGARPPYLSALCGKCGAGVKVVTGRAPMNLPGYPSLLRLGQVRYCPGKQVRR